MRIISKFHDYYDRAMGYGQDRSLVFVRNEAPAKEAPELMHPPHWFDVNGRNWRARCNPFAIAFCGRIYRGITALVSSTDFYAGVPELRHSFYRLDALSAFLSTKGLALAERRGRKRWWFTEQNWRDFMEKPQADASAEAWFIDRKISVMVWDRELMIGRETGIFVNPMLKRYEFFRVYDAFQTFQELSMFVGGVLPGADADMAVVSDKDRIAQRGFDKWSFRKMPEVKR